MAKGTINKVIVLGRVGQDPDSRQTASGTQVVNLSIATNELGPKNDQGQRQDQTEWHRVTLFGRTAEVASQYLRKGSLVYVEGRLQTRKWQDQNGQDRYTTEIVGYEMQLIGGKNENQQGQPIQQQAPAQPMQQGRAPQQQQSQGFYRPPQGQQAPQQPQAPAQGFDDFDDDIPFS